MLTRVVGPFLHRSHLLLLLFCFVGWELIVYEEDDTIYFIQWLNTQFPSNSKRKTPFFKKKISVNISFCVIILLEYYYIDDDDYFYFYVRWCLCKIATKVIGSSLNGIFSLLTFSCLLSDLQCLRMCTQKIVDSKPFLNIQINIKVD